MNYWALDQNDIASDKRLAFAMVVALGLHALLLLLIFASPPPPPPRAPSIELTLDAPLAGKTVDASPSPSPVINKELTTPSLASAQGTFSDTMTPPKPGSGKTDQGSEGATDSPVHLPSPDLFNRLNQAVSQSLKTGYMTSRTVDGPAGQYLAKWKRQVESYVNQHYPEELKSQHLSGQLILEVTINQGGHVLNIAVRQSSGNTTIDEAARRMVQLASPYPPFPPKLAAQYDQINITRTWLFTSGQQLSTH